MSKNNGIFCDEYPHMITFSNHSPLRVGAPPIAVADLRPEWGHCDYHIYQGTRLHLVGSSNSGMDYGHGTVTTRTYYFGSATKEEMISYLLQQIKNGDRQEFGIPVSACNELLDDLGYEGEEA